MTFMYPLLFHLHSSCRMEDCEGLGLNQLLKLQGGSFTQKKLGFFHFFQKHQDQIKARFLHFGSFYDGVDHCDNSHDKSHRCFPPYTQHHKKAQSWTCTLTNPVLVLTLLHCIPVAVRAEKKSVLYMFYLWHHDKITKQTGRLK